MSLDVEVGFDEDEILQILDQPQGQQREDVLKLEIVVRRWSLVVEVHKYKLLLSPAYDTTYSGLKFLRKNRVSYKVWLPGGGCRKP